MRRSTLLDRISLPCRDRNGTVQQWPLAIHVQSAPGFSLPDDMASTKDSTTLYFLEPQECRNPVSAIITAFCSCPKAKLLTSCAEIQPNTAQWFLPVVLHLCEIFGACEIQPLSLKINSQMNMNVVFYLLSIRICTVKLDYTVLTDDGRRKAPAHRAF
ncbi:hypothetical protein Bbelb_244840 [Branchiostoma belcheri]|nr:hypothetical protein Bbelb_244840 [Branchiostoma belcheri]